MGDYKKLMNSRLLMNSTYGSHTTSITDLCNSYTEAIEIFHRDFSIYGDFISNQLMEFNNDCNRDINYPIKLSDIRFGKPITGLIKARPSAYGVVSIHRVAGYKITIKRFYDTSDDTVWYESPMDSYYCKIKELEKILYEHILEAIEKDAGWKRVK